MKAFLFFLILGGAALYTFLVVTHDALQDGKTETTLAVQTQPNQPVVKQASSWGTYLSQTPEAPLAQQTAALPPQPSPSQDLDRMPGVDHQFAASEDKAATAQSDSADQEPVELAKVMLAAQTHSQASVSSPTVRFYRPGTELQIIRREGIWLEVSDPVTRERGWVLAQYLASIESPTPTQVATESTTEAPTVISPKSNKRHRSAKHAVHGVVVANADPWNARWARRADRRRGFGLFMFRPLPRFAQAR
jgi:hypothetical protein